MQQFLAGFIVGVVGMVFVFLALRVRCSKRNAMTKPDGNSAPHTDTASAAKIGHDRGIEVFDD